MHHERVNLHPSSTPTTLRPRGGCRLIAVRRVRFSRRGPPGPLPARVLQAEHNRRQRAPTDAACVSSRVRSIQRCPVCLLPPGCPVGQVAGFGVRDMTVDLRNPAQRHKPTPLLPAELARAAFGDLDELPHLLVHGCLALPLPIRCLFPRCDVPGHWLAGVMLRHACSPHLAEHPALLARSTTVSARLDEQGTAASARRPSTPRSTWFARVLSTFAITSATASAIPESQAHWPFASISRKYARRQDLHQVEASHQPEDTDPYLVRHLTRIGT